MRKKIIFRLGVGISVFSIVWLMAQQLSREPEDFLEKILTPRPMVYLQVKDASQLLKRYRESQLKTAYEQGQSFSDFQKSKLYVKLEERIKTMAEVSGFKISLENVCSFLGKQSAVWLFDLAELKFVAATVLEENKFAASILTANLQNFDQRQEGNLTYQVKESMENGVVLAWARMGNLLVFSHNDLPDFLRLCESLRESRDWFSQAEKAFRKIFGSEVACHQVTLYLTSAAIQNTYFRSWWLFRNEKDWRWVEQGLLDWEEGKNQFLERRYFLPEQQLETSTFDLQNLLSAVPARISYLRAEKEHNSDVMFQELARYFLPDLDQTSRQEPLVSLLEAAKPDAYAVFLEPVFNGDLFLHWKKGLLIHLSQPDNFPQKNFLARIKEIYEQAFFSGRARKSGFSWKETKLKTNSVFSLKIPLFPYSGIVVSQAGAFVLLTNVEDFLHASFEGKDKSWQAEAGCEKFIWVDAERLWQVYEKTINFLAACPDWRTEGTASFFRDNLGSVAIWFSPLSQYTFEQRVKNSQRQQVIRYTLK